MMMKWMKLHLVTLLLQLYFNNVIVLQPKKGVADEKNQNHWNCRYVDRKWCAGGDIGWIILLQLSWHVVPSSIIFSPYLKTSPMGNGCGKHAATNSVYCPSHDAVHENTGFAFSTIFWPCFSASSLSYHFGSRFLVTTWSQILQLLQTGAEIWAQLCSCPECWVHTVCCWWSWPKHKFTGCPHGMKWMIMQTFYWVGPQPGESYAKLWKWRSYKLLATFRSAIPFHFLWG